MKPAGRQFQPHGATARKRLRRPAKHIPATEANFKNGVTTVEFQGGEHRGVMVRVGSIGEPPHEQSADQAGGFPQLGGEQSGRPNERGCHAEP
jgi:hypothetical protein